MLNTPQTRLHQYVNQELSDVQAGLQRRIRDQIANIHGSWRTQGSSKKTSTSVLSTTLKPLTVWITINCGKFLEMGIPGHFISLLRNLYAGQEATEPDMEQQTGWKLRKLYMFILLI